MRICLYISMYMGVYACVYACVRVCVYACVYLCMRRKSRLTDILEPGVDDLVGSYFVLGPDTDNTISDVEVHGSMLTESQQFVGVRQLFEEDARTVQGQLGVGYERNVDDVALSTRRFQHQLVLKEGRHGRCYQV